MKGILHMSEILHISQRLFTFRRDSSYLEGILRMSEILHVSPVGLYLYFSTNGPSLPSNEYRVKAGKA
jgi:hypothetical protein